MICKRLESILTKLVRDTAQGLIVRSELCRLWFDMPTTNGLALNCPALSVKPPQDSGLGRESLYKALAPGAKPRFETVMKVVRVLGVKLTADTV